ncbi:hypothetical protein IW262DRAFT_1276923 [Armillaria fumosa]|nr:hypothetical protein IW262DRAFT_1276923 [Armillaria fumosa]
MPETEVHASTNIRQLLDVGDLPITLEEEAWQMLESHVRVFGFDGRLGNFSAEVKIPIKEEAEPISLTMYVTSPGKREVINQQINVWFEKGIIEPSRSLWGAQVVIAYHNGKPRFCIDYQ